MNKFGKKWILLLGVFILLLGFIVINPLGHEDTLTKTSENDKAIYDQLKEIPQFKIESGNFIFVNSLGQEISTDIQVSSEEQGYLTRDNVYERGQTLAVTIPKGDAVEVYYSHDGGVTWANTPINDSVYGDFTAFNIYVGYEDDLHGWVLVGGDVGLGRQEHFIYITEDGGATWTEIPNAMATYSRVIAGGAFINPQEAYITYRYDVERHGPLYKTQDGGQHWEQVSLDYPEKYENLGLTLASPRFNGNYGIIPVTLSDEADYSQIVFYFYTSDGGQTWTTGK